MADYWRKILEKLEKMLDSSDFRVWIEPLTAEIAGHSLVLSMPGASSYYLGRLKKRFEPVIRTAAAEAFSCSRDDVELTFKSVAASRDSVSVKKISVAVRKSEKASSPAEEPVRPRIVAPGLLPQAPLNRPCDRLRAGFGTEDQPLFLREFRGGADQQDGVRRGRGRLPRRRLR